MGFQKGQPRPPNAGRKPGSKNKKKIFNTSEILANKDINPTEEILKLIPEMNVREKVEAWKYLHSFTEAKPRMPEAQVEESESSIDKLEDIDTENLIALAKS